MTTLMGAEASHGVEEKIICNWSNKVEKEEIGKSWVGFLKLRQVEMLFRN